ncbi:hypothetical protein LJK87_02340 [Paenibacillus sp. P25]|nr:hypothetical protein LJK87_02340 [Paenibacillus sp. P25]
MHRFRGTRIVYDLGNGYVLKLAKSKKGIKCNRMEADLYRSTKESLKRHLAEIKSHDPSYRWVMMKKYSTAFPNRPAYRRKLKHLVERLRASGITPSKGVGRYNTPYAPNLRLKRNKEIVVIDYGGFHYTLDR